MYSITAAQNISKHQWKNRLVLILADDAESTMLKEQLNIFKANESGLEDRKLLVYQILPEQYKIGLNQKANWLPSGKLFQKYNSGRSVFEVILIGLDGGVKMKQSELLTIEDLFGTIDVMPMRRAELRRRQ